MITQGKFAECKFLVTATSQHHMQTKRSPHLSLSQQ